MHASNIALLLVGLGLLSAGVLLVLRRVAIAKFFANGQQAMFGRAGDKTAVHSTPLLAASLGVFGIALGLLSLFSALFLEVSS